MFYFIIFILFNICSSIKKPKLCINCKYFRNNLFQDPEYGKCSLFTKKINTNLVTGITNYKNYYYCSTARSFEDMCYIDGKFYVKKN